MDGKLENVIKIVGLNLFFWWGGVLKVKQRVSGTRATVGCLMLYKVSVLDQNKIFQVSRLAFPS